MSALKPANEKYRRTWKIWGNQMIPSKAYKDNYDKIKWTSDYKIPGLKRSARELTSDKHYELKFESE